MAALALATLLPAAVAAGTLHAPGASASGSEGPRRDYAGQPTGTVKPLAETGRRRRSGPLRLRLRGRPLAGIPGQSLRLRFSFGRGQRPKRVKLLLRRVGRADPRHARRLGGELVARRVVPVAGRRVRTGLGPLRLEPGPHRLTVRSLARRAAGHRGRRWGSVTVAVAPPAAAATGGGAAASAHPARAEARAALRAVGTEQVPQDLSFRPGSEASSAIAVEDDNPDRVIAAANDAGGVPPAFVSNEGLAAGSVRTRQMPALARLPGGGQATLQRCCDPAVAADANGNLWMAIATGGGSGPIALGRIAPASTSFGTMSTALPTAPGSTAQEKPALAVLSDTTIAAAWIETTGGVQNVVYSECDLSGDAADCDEPDAWSPPVPVTAASGLYAMPTLDLSPSGDVYVGWWDAGADNAIELDRCLAAESCGSAAAWDEEAPVAALDAFDDDGVGGDDPLPLRCPIIGAPGGLVNPSPSLRVGPDGTVYVAYGDLRDNADPDSPTRCTAAGSDETFDVLVAAGTTPGCVPGRRQRRAAQRRRGAGSQRSLPCRAQRRTLRRRGSRRPSTRPTPTPAASGPGGSTSPPPMAASAGRRRRTSAAPRPASRGHSATASTMATGRGPTRRAGC